MPFKLNTETTCFRKGVGFHPKPVVASAPIDVYIIIFFNRSCRVSNKMVVHTLVF